MKREEFNFTAGDLPLAGRLLKLRTLNINTSTKLFVSRKHEMPSEP